MGMVSQELVAQHGAVEVKIELGSGYRLMAEHLLDGAQIRASLEEMCGEGVAQRVRTYGFLNAGGGRQVADYIEHHHPRQGRAAPVEEDYVLSGRFYIEPLAHRKIVAYEFDGGGG